MTSGGALEPGGEDERVADALARIPHAGFGLALGPGHDCAVLDPSGGALVVTTDVLVDGVHFVLARDGPEAAARKALLVNLSDLAAAAARPLAFQVGVVLPRGRDAGALLSRLAEGLAGAARQWRCPCAGGDTNVAAGPLVLAVTAFGRPGPLGVVTRDGARVGDRLSVTGPLGGSRTGRHLAFVPRVDEALHLARLGVPHGMMDLSDGLARDLPRLCRASRVGAVLEAAKVPLHPDAATVDDGRSPLQHALGDGEDFELLVAHAPLSPETADGLAGAGVTLIEIGEIRAASEGVSIVQDGSSRPLESGGYDHFLASGD